MRRFLAIAPLLLSTPGACSELDKLTGHYAPTAQEQWEGGPNGHGVYFAPRAPGAGGGALHQAPPITRDGLDWVKALGGVLDDAGNYSTPIPASQVYGVPVGDGIYSHPPEWDGSGDFNIRLEVQDGYVTRQDIQFNK